MIAVFLPMPEAMLQSDGMSGGNEGNKRGEGHRKRLRERFENAGFSAFAPHEILELLLTLCIPRRDVKEPAKRLLERFGSLRAVLDASAEDLRTVDGIGSVTPVALRVIREAASLYLQQGVEGRDVLDSVYGIANFLRMRFAGMKCECLEIMHLDSGRRLLPNGVERLDSGGVDQVALPMRKLLESALKRGSRFIILAHNHPGGAMKFSREDIELTRNVQKAAQTLEIELCDHLLVVDDSVLSMREEGLLHQEAQTMADSISYPFSPASQRMVAESEQSPYGTSY